jgi:hypothetical protein
MISGCTKISWKGPVVVGAARQLMSLTCLPPIDVVSLQTSFFMPSFGRHPGAAGFAPAGRGGDAELQPELVGALHSETEGSFHSGDM